MRAASFEKPPRQVRLKFFAGAGYGPITRLGFDERSVFFRSDSAEGLGNTVVPTYSLDYLLLIFRHATMIERPAAMGDS